VATPTPKQGHLDKTGHVLGQFCSRETTEKNLANDKRRFPSAKDMFRRLAAPRWLGTLVKGGHLLTFLDLTLLSDFVPLPP
jgi:hypothetical protein